MSYPILPQQRTAAHGQSPDAGVRRRPHPHPPGADLSRPRCSGGGACTGAAAFCDTLKQETPSDLGRVPLVAFHTHARYARTHRENVFHPPLTPRRLLPTMHLSRSERPEAGSAPC